MKYDPKANMGDHEESDSGEEEGHGSTGPEIKGGDLKKKKKKGGMYSKSLTGDDLQKSLDAIEASIDAEDGPSRKQVLLEKSMNNECSPEETTELIDLMGGQNTVQKSQVAGDILEPFNTNEPLQKALDVSEYLQENHDALGKSLETVAEAIEKSDYRRHEAFVLQSRAILDIGNLVKSVAQTLGVIAEQPVSGPKSAGVTGGTRPLQKSFNGAPAGDGENMSKSMIFDALETLDQESMEKGMDGRLATGERFDVEISKFEQTGMLAPNVHQAVREFHARKAAH